MVNFGLIIRKIEDLKNVRGDKHVAGILGLSPQDFSNRKKRGSLLPAILEWAINENVNLDWLIKDEINKELPVSGGEPATPYNGATIPLISDIPPAEKKIKKLCVIVRRVIEEGDVKKIKALEAQLDVLDPGTKNKNKINESDESPTLDNSHVA